MNKYKSSQNKKWRIITSTYYASQHVFIVVYEYIEGVEKKLIIVFLILNI
jgi:hypothetical protein